jgi:hypothetical protein
LLPIPDTGPQHVERATLNLVFAYQHILNANQGLSASRSIATPSFESKQRVKKSLTHAFSFLAALTAFGPPVVEVQVQPGQTFTAYVMEITDGECVRRPPPD